MYDIVKQLPMMQGLFDIVELVGSEYKGSREAVEATMEAMSKRLTAAALTVIPGFAGSLTATVERVASPTRSDTGLTADQLEAGMFGRGFYKAMNIFKSRNGFYSSDVEPKLNRWAEEMKQCENGGWCFITPVRVISSKHRAVDEEMVNLNLGLGEISNVQLGIELGVGQKNDIIREMNRIERPRGDGQAGTWRLLEELNWYIKTEAYLRNADGSDRGKGEKLKDLRSIDNRYLEEARATVFARNSSLQAKVKLRKENLKNFGKGKAPASN
jgi:hypothetical protein